MCKSGFKPLVFSRHQCFLLTCLVNLVPAFYLDIYPLGDKVSMLTHTYPHKARRKIEVTICKITRLTAHFMCGLMSDLLICTCLYLKVWSYMTLLRPGVIKQHKPNHLLRHSDLNDGHERCKWSVYHLLEVHCSPGYFRCLLYSCYASVVQCVVHCTSLTHCSVCSGPARVIVGRRIGSGAACQLSREP